MRATAPDGSFTTGLEPLFKEVDLRRIPRTGRVHLALLQAEQSLWLALGTGGDIVLCLAEIRTHLREHRANVEAEGSLSDSVRSEDPWLLSHLNHLLHHHDELEKAILVADAEYARSGHDPDAGARVNRRARSIGVKLSTLLTVERSLLMNQFCEPQAQD